MEVINFYAQVTIGSNKVRTHIFHKFHVILYLLISKKILYWLNKWAPQIGFNLVHWRQKLWIFNKLTWLRIVKYSCLQFFLKNLRVNEPKQNLSRFKASIWYARVKYNILSHNQRFVKNKNGYFVYPLGFTRRRFTMFIVTLHPGYWAIFLTVV